MIKNFDEILNRLKVSDKPKTMAVVAAHDEHTIEAALNAQKRGIAVPILIGDKKKITRILENEFNKPEIIDEPDDEKACAIGVRLANKGEAQFVMKGNTDTKVILKALLNDNPIKERENVFTHISAISMPTYHKLLYITDGGMIPYPTLEDKIKILKNASNFLYSLGYEEPKVAVLAAVEKYNPKLREVVEGVKLKEMAKKGEFGKCIVEAPISFDLIYQKEAAVIKKFESPVAGDADVILTPDMCCGNILAKSLSIAGGGIFSGIIYGALYPIVLTSRSMSAEEKFSSIALAALVKRRGL